MTMTFDKGTDSQRELKLNYANENITENRLNGNNSIDLQTGTIPDLSEFIENPDFSTVELKRESGSAIPLQGDYNRITGLSATVDEMSGRYNVMIALGKVVQNA